MDEAATHRRDDKWLEHIAASNVTGGLYCLSQFPGGDAFRSDGPQPAGLDGTILARRESQVAMLCEERIEVFEKLVGLIQRTGPILDKASQLEADHPSRSGPGFVFVHRHL